MEQILMNIKTLIDARRLTVATAAALAATLAAATTAAATPYRGSSHTAARAAGSASVANDTLTIVGTNQPDQVTISVGTDPSTLLVGFGGNGSHDQKFDHNTFSAINTFLRGGNDRFSVTGVPFSDKRLTVDAGDGDDNVQTGAGNDVIIGGTGNDTINSGAGNDVIDSGGGVDDVTGGTGADTAFLGSDADRFVWNPGDGSDVVNGDGGIDTLVFNGSPGDEVMNVSANGGRAVFLRDPGQVRMDLDSVERLNVQPLGGADAVTINDTTGTGLVQANIDLSVAGNGDAKIDTVTVNGTEQADQVRVHPEGSRVDVKGLQPETRISGSEPTDRLQVNTSGGNDKVRVDDGVSRLISVAADLGAGQR
jgi:hemolysin type calcium-binding protein